MDVVDWMLTYQRPPDIPNERGIGRADPGLPTVTGGNTWPPNEELAMEIPEGMTASDQQGNTIEIDVRLSPMCYPMHDHSEPSQTSQGGNYNMGMIAGMNFIGDRNTPGAMSFPHQPLVFPAGADPQNTQPTGVVTGPHTTATQPPWYED